MALVDSYVKLQAESIALGENPEINIDDQVIREILRRKTVRGETAARIRFFDHIPQTAIEEICNAFGNVYCENPEGYVIIIQDDIRIYSQSKRGWMYAAYNLADKINAGSVQKGIVYNYPDLQDRGLKLYIPKREDIGYFKEIVDLCAYYGYNQIMLETGGAFEYKKHPEINQGWIEYCKRFGDYQGQSLDVQNSCKWARNSIHCENGGGSFLTQEEIAELIDYCNLRHFEVIPEVPSLSHCDYILAAHPELRERQEDDLPDTYCPSNPASYELLFDILDEIIAVFQPHCVHIGHDEYFSVGLCPKCREKEAYHIYADDVIKIHDYLKEKGIKTALWGDKLLNAIGKLGQTWGGSRRIIVNARTNAFLEEVPATYPAIDLIPKDIIIYHWYWGLNMEWEKEFLGRGFETVMGNFDGLCIKDFKRRAKSSFCGISISNWSALNPEHMQRNAVLMNLAYSSYMLWNKEFDENAFEENCLYCARDLYRYNLRSYENYFEVIYRTTLYKKHEPFVDGFAIDQKDDYLGKLEITLEDGNRFYENIYYNLNIGTSGGSFLLQDATDTENMVYDAQIFESTYSCEIVKENGEIFYKTAIRLPENERVRSVKVIQDSKYGQNIQMLGFSM